MREIKFRAWDKVSKVMSKVLLISYPFFSDDFHEDYVILSQNLPIKKRRRLKNQIILMQYTGLKDKNGKEIYEGDIMSSGYVVKFKYREYIDGSCNGYDSFHMQGEILGNIYENQNLLLNNK